MMSLSGKETDKSMTLRLYTVLKKLQKARVALNIEKCELSKTEVKFRGHILSADRVKPE